MGDVKEIWNPVVDHPGYEVNTIGKVRNMKTGRILREDITYRGYARVNLHGRHCYIHRLVADAFFVGRNGDMDVRHIDGDKLNNWVNNLERCTRGDNVRKYFKMRKKLCKNT